MDTKRDKATINIPDPGLNDAIHEKLGLASTASVTLDEMTKLYNLDNAADRGIISLEGLQYAVNVQELILDNNDVADLSPLQNLENLRDVSLPRNSVEDLAPIQYLQGLHGLNINNNDIKAIGALRDLKTLGFLLMNNNKITDLRPLRHILPNFAEDMVSITVQNQSPTLEKTTVRTGARNAQVAWVAIQGQFHMPNGEKVYVSGPAVEDGGPTFDGYNVSWSIQPRQTSLPLTITAHFTLAGDVTAIYSANAIIPVQWVN